MNALTARRFLSPIGFGVGGAAAAILLYGMVAVIFGIIPVNRDYKPVRGGIDVYLRSNGVHVDLVVPIDAGGVDWQTRLPANALGKLLPVVATDLAFGWGDRGFYLATPAWGDLKASTAMWAVTGADTTVMHVEAAMIPSGPATRHIMLSPEQYRRLAHYIENSFGRDETGAVIIVASAHYGSNDAFFEATGHYSAFKTCNEWTRQGLVTAGVRAPLWSPFDTALLYQLPLGD